MSAIKPLTIILWPMLIFIVNHLANIVDYWKQEWKINKLLKITMILHFNIFINKVNALHYSNKGIWTSQISFTGKPVHERGCMGLVNFTSCMWLQSTIGKQYKVIPILIFDADCRKLKRLQDSGQTNVNTYHSIQVTTLLYATKLA